AEAHRLPVEKQVLRHREVRQQIDLLVDGGDAGLKRGPGRARRDLPAARPARPERAAPPCPPSRPTPASRGNTPVTTLISVDLPAPFSPSSAWISPARSVKSTSCNARTAPKLLLIPRTSSREAAESWLFSMTFTPKGAR